MKLIVTFSVIFFAFLATQSNVNAIKCYVCSNLLGDECKNVNDEMIQDCTGMVSCFKATMTSPNMNVLSRTCGGSLLTYNNECRDEKQGDLSGTICECSTDLCNSASSVVARFVVMIPIFLVFAMKYLW